MSSFEDREKIEIMSDDDIDSLPIDFVSGDLISWQKNSYRQSEKDSRRRILEQSDLDSIDPDDYEAISVNTV